MIKRIISIVLILFAIIASYRRNMVWFDDLNLWGDVIAKSPGKSTGYNSYGLALFKKGLEEAAYFYFIKAIEIDPDSVEPYLNLGNFYATRGKFKEAERYYLTAINLNPFYAKAYYNLGLVYLNIDDKEKAYLFFEKTLELEPYHEGARLFIKYLSK